MRHRFHHATLQVAQSPEELEAEFVAAGFLEAGRYEGAQPALTKRTYFELEEGGWLFWVAEDPQRSDRGPSPVHVTLRHRPSPRGLELDVQEVAERRPDMLYVALLLSIVVWTLLRSPQTFGEFVWPLAGLVLVPLVLLGLTRPGTGPRDRLAMQRVGQFLAPLALGLGSNAGAYRAPRRPVRPVVAPVTHPNSARFRVPRIDICS